MLRTDPQARLGSFRWPVSLLFLPFFLAAAPVASAQSPGGAPTWHLGWSVVSWTNDDGAASVGCHSPQGQLGDFCASAGGTGIGGVLAVGKTIGERASVEMEAALGTARTGSATYYRYAGHFATDRTDATYTHREYLFSTLFRFRPGATARRVGFELVVGPTLALGTDRLTEQVEVYEAAYANYRRTTYPEDASASNWAAGATGGADLVIAAARRLAVVGTARLRFVAWRDVDPLDIPDDAVPVGVGRLSFQLGAGLRWGDPK